MQWFVKDGEKAHFFKRAFWETNPKPGEDSQETREVAVAEGVWVGQDWEKGGS